MVLGHLTVTAAGKDLLRRAGHDLPTVSTPLLLVGAYLPDLVDKPLNRIAGLASRGYGHSLLVQVLVFGLLWLLFAKARRAVLSLAIGAVAHVAEDAVPLKGLLAPLLGPVPQAPQWSFWESFTHFYRGGGGFLFWLEVLALGYWTLIGAGRMWAPRAGPTAHAARG